MTPYRNRLRALLRAIALTALLMAPVAPASSQEPRQPIDPVLDFPEPGVDDPAAYDGYRTRFYRDAAGNTVQIYIRGKEGRVVTLLANDANESIGFTIRDSLGNAVAPEWEGTQAAQSSSGDTRSLEFRLTTPHRRIDLGWFLLGTMRVERDLQYEQRHLRPFTFAAFPRPELTQLLANLRALPAAERQRHLELLNAADTAELRARLRPSITRAEVDTSWIVTIAQPSFDGRSHLAVELRVSRLAAHVQTTARTVTIRSRTSAPITFAVRITTNATPLTPIARGELFNREFERFLADARARAERGDDPAATLRYRWLDRQVRGLELVSSREKLMAGLPNFATYFGRDMLMSSLMMEPIWSAGMLEHVIASVLRKIAANGEVSHEEALSGQAIRENAAIYNERIAAWRRHRAAGARARADSALGAARDILGRLHEVRENYHMLDDDVQFPVVVARYLRDARVPAERKRAFLMERAGADTATRLTMLLRNLEFVTRSAAPYARQPVATNLIAFPPRPNGRFHPGSWRDSNAGYGNGRFAMDINAIWVPLALEAAVAIRDALSGAGLVAGEAAAQRDSLRRMAEVWRGAARHFVVRLEPATIRARVRARLAAMAAEERAYWTRIFTESHADSTTLEFLALSLDATGRPLRVVNTDPAMHFILEDLPLERVRRDMDAIMRPYPVGLFVEKLGPVVANDAYATPAIWQDWNRDLYHSPKVVWGREVNLIALGLARQIAAAHNESGQLRDPAAAADVATLRDALRRVDGAIDASGLSHNELWSYRIENGELTPVRYGASSDIQLWNLTNLAVQFLLSTMPQP